MGNKIRLYIRKSWNIHFWSMLWGKASKIGFFHLLSANILLQIAGFGGQIFLTRILSVEDIGRIKILQSVLGIVIIVAGLGLNVAILKCCSEEIDRKRTMLLFSNGFKITTIFSLLVTIILMGMSSHQFFSNDEVTNSVMMYYMLQVPFMVINNFCIFYLQSQKKIKAMSKIQSISKIIIIFVSTITAYFCGLYGYVLGIVLSNLITVFISMSLIKFEIRNSVKIKLEKPIVTKMFKIGMFSLLSNLVGQLIFSLNVLMLSHVVNNNQEIGYYGVAQMLLTSLMIIPNTLSQIMIPYISAKSEDIVEVQKMLKKYEKKMNFLVISLVVVMYFLIPIMIPIVFGDNYSESIVYFRILLIGMLFWGIYSPKGITLVSIGRVEFNFYVSIGTLVINMVMNILLITKFEVIGAAVATTLTYFFTIFINNYFYKKALIRQYSYNTVD